jgi:very-short-patch-repair endonuclease
LRRYIVRGLRVTGVKQERARELRREMTREESLLWEALRDGKLGARFRRQQVIAGFIADFYCARYGLIVEADGSHHSPESDGEREAILVAHNLRLLRFSNARIREDLPLVIAEIRAEIETKSPLSQRA